MFCPYGHLTFLFFLQLLKFRCQVGLYLFNLHLGFWEVFGLRFFKTSKGSLGAFHLLKGTSLIFTNAIVPTTSLANWGLVLLIITFKFLLNHYPF